MGRYDRDEVLARTDLTALASELCGEPRGRGVGAKWHCPNPDHPDTHPSMTVFRGQRNQRWKCHSCGDGGTAIDLWMTVKRCDVRQAIEDLGDRARAPKEAEPWSPSPRSANRPDLVASASPAGGRTDAPPEPGPPKVDPCVEQYVATAAELLWGPRGEAARTWLHNRGLTDDVLRANRVGYDPGRHVFSRPRGLPRRPQGAGVVYPVLGTDGIAVYFQLRYLDPLAAGRDKYDNPWSGLATNPHVAVLRVPAPDPALAGIAVVAEGIPDGLVVAQVGAPVAAVIGSGNYGPDIAPRINRAFPTGRLVIPWDADRGGRKGSCVLGARLVQLGRDVLLTAPPEEHNDIGKWWQEDPRELTATLRSFDRPALYPGFVAEPAYEIGPPNPQTSPAPSATATARRDLTPSDAGLGGS